MDDDPAGGTRGINIGATPVAWIARIGYGARGAVFLIVGVFALRTAIGAGGQPRGISGALRWLFEYPFGGILLWILALGLSCFAGWRLMQGIFNADRHGSSLYGLLHRAVYVCNGLFYLGLATATAGSTVEFGWVQGDQSARDWTAWLMAKPLGRAAIALIAFCFVITAIGVGVAAFRKPYWRRINAQKMPPVWAATFGILGILTRAAVFLMIGAFHDIRLAVPNTRCSGAAHAFSEANRLLVCAVGAPFRRRSDQKRRIFHPRRLAGRLP